MVNVYGSQKLSPDFNQFKQIPKFGAVYTITPVLAVRWPEFGFKGSAEIKYKAIPVWIQHNSIQKRGILDTVKNFLQIVVSGQLPLIVSGSLSKFLIFIKK
jgi:hypothetical protein